MTVVDGYFAYFDYNKDSLFYKTDDGIIAFSYPLDTLITADIIKGVEYDGVNFWTLEQTDTTNALIRRWRVENYICKQKQTISLTASANHVYKSNAFTVEHYHTTVTGTYGIGSGSVGIPGGYGTKLDNAMTITLGPNTDGDSETILVDAYNTATGEVTLQSNTTYAYTVDDPAIWYNYLWVFNNADGVDETTGALYKIDAYTNLGTSDPTAKYTGGAYKDIEGCTFYNVDSFNGITTSGSVDALCYVKASNILFVDVSTVGAELDYYGSMVIDWTSIADVWDLAMYDQNIYRLQGSGPYNYELSTLDSLITSIAMTAAPAIITANGSSTTDIYAYVKDQFFQPVIGKLVSFTENGDGSIISACGGGGTTCNTDSNGMAWCQYQAGNSAITVTVTATVQQT